MLIIRAKLVRNVQQTVRRIDISLESERIKVPTELTHFRNRVVHFLEVIHGCVIIVVLSSAFEAQHAEKLGTVASGNFLSRFSDLIL